MIPKQMQDNNQVGLYMRLSKDDERQGESLSIENQRGILTKYVAERGWNVVDEYIDDGVSGTTFDRPEVQRLLEDAKNGRIDVIVVKDLSRFGRNYIQVGQYVDYIFPMYNIRFIAISDNVDTANSNSSGMDMMPIMNVFNEWHCANTSKKIRAVVEANARAGKYVSKFAPYGYVKGTADQAPLVIDEPAAQIVRRIFEMRASGMSQNAISSVLNDEQIPIPADYQHAKYGKVVRRSDYHLWSGTIVRNILTNVEYIGTLVRLKFTKMSYKTKRRVHREPLLFPNAFEPIISQELWDRVRELDRSVSRGRRSSDGDLQPLSGLLICADCGGKMKLQRHFFKGKKHPEGYELTAYVCGSNARFGKHYCFNHYIRSEKLNAMVLADIRDMARLVLENEEQARADFLRDLQRSSEATTAADSKALAQKRSRLVELERLIQSVYEDKVLGRIPEEICLNLLSKYTDEKKALIPEIQELEKRISKTAQNAANVDEFIRRIKQLVNVSELTRELCIQIIDRIEVGAKQPDGNRTIQVYYKLLSDNQ